MPKKLKRFLLRYDPPGIGLEVAEDDEVSVVHKDLPKAEEMMGHGEICREVDRIISEDELLTRKRHRSALIQLLCRLYKVEFDDAMLADPVEDDSPRAKPSPKGASPSDLLSMLEEGSQVVMLGFTGEQAMFNGEVGTVTKCRHEKSKYEVMVKREEVKFKGVEHMVLCKHTPLVVGTAVVIRGLRNHTELNGCLGKVVECHEETHRFEVRATESGQLFRVKQENLVPIDAAFLPPAGGKENKEPNSMHTPRSLRKEGDSAASLAQGGLGDDPDVYEAGTLVELQGLQTAKTYNGQTAEVLSVDRARSRYEIRLHDGSLKTIRAENVRVVSRPSKTSPRNHRRKEGGAKAADRGR